MVDSLQRPVSWQLIRQGAEARIYSGEFLGKPVIVKERFQKSYRLPELDRKLTHRRMAQEIRSIARCRKHGIRAPAVYHFDYEHRLLYLENIADGVLVKEYVNQLDGEGDGDGLQKLMDLIGTTLAKMHSVDVVHGDLTTSNMIFDCVKGNLTLIDFGLSHVSSLIEDKAVDLYVLERAFLSTHPRTEEQFRTLLSSYSSSSTSTRAVSKKLDEVRMRGRKRIMVG